MVLHLSWYCFVSADADADADDDDDDRYIET